MKLRFYFDEGTGDLHIHGHQVTQEEVEEVLTRPMEERPSAQGGMICLGRTAGGRFLRVIDVPDPEPDSVFVITAYEPGPRVLKALGRRPKKKQR